MEPQKGLFKNFVVALDYKSLYPSIISEFNICFSSLRSVAQYPITNEETIIDDYMGEIEENIKRIKQRALLP